MDNLDVTENRRPGLTPVRTMRIISVLLALTGMCFMFLEQVLSAVLVMATDAVKLGLARYNNFTGRFAAQNFAEDKQLLTLLKETQNVLPSLESALTVLLVVSIVLLALAAVGLALPRPCVHVLVALKLLKWETGEAPEQGKSLKEALSQIGEVPLKKLAIPFGILLVLVIGVFVVRGCSEKVHQGSMENALDEMQQHSAAYIEAQRAYFAKNKAVGGPKSLKMADSLSTDFFKYKVTGSRFVAELKTDIEKCHAGNKWSIIATTKGIFDKELRLARIPPKDTACARLTPDYKKLGRKQ